MKKVSLIPYFIFAFIFYLTSPMYSRYYPILQFAPFFTTLYARKNLFFCIWASFFIGIFLDFSTTSTPIGFYPLCTILTTLLLHPLKIYFFEEKPYVFCLYTTVYSICYSIIFSLLYSLIEYNFNPLHLSFLLDIFVLPLIDTLYHITCFILPIYLYLYLSPKTKSISFYKIKKIVKIHFSVWIQKVTHVFKKRTH